MVNEVQRQLPHDFAQTFRKRPVASPGARRGIAETTALRGIMTAKYDGAPVRMAFNRFLTTRLFHENPSHFINRINSAARRCW